MLPKKLQKKLDARKATQALRVLTPPANLVDFSSNDYLGFSSNSSIAQKITARAQAILQEEQLSANGATGSRLLSGNHKLYARTEEMLADFHKAESALVFNSGYDANVGFFQSVPQRGDLILYDEYIHASIRDGIQMSPARGYKFKHNDIASIKKLVSRLREMHHLDDQEGAIELYLVTESVFSMDGDTPDLLAIADICMKNGIHLIIDEAHATAVLGPQGAGLVQELHLEDKVFARIITFGKGIGAHGAAILGSEALRSYLVNFARSFIYTTGLPPHSLAVILSAYEQLLECTNEDAPEVVNLRKLINHFKAEVQRLALDKLFIDSESAIHCGVIRGNDAVKTLSRKLKENNFNVKPILSPTVPQGQERLRICLHAYNSKDEVTELLELIKSQL